MCVYIIFSYIAIRFYNTYCYIRIFQCYFIYCYIRIFRPIYLIVITINSFTSNQRYYMYYLYNLHDTHSTCLIQGATGNPGEDWISIKLGTNILG